MVEEDSSAIEMTQAGSTYYNGGWRLLGLGFFYLFFVKLMALIP